MNQAFHAARRDGNAVVDEVMIVDDTPENLKLLTALFLEQGYRVRPAASGTMALRSAAAKAPALILLDVRLPDMDGYSVCRRIKADANLRSVPVIFISAMDEVSDKVEGFNAGAVDYLTKPLEPTEVLARVRTHLDLVHLRRQQEQAQAGLERQVEARTAELATANRALSESEERLRMVFEATSDGVWDWNPMTGRLFFSDRWYVMLGYLPGEFPAAYESWRSLVHADDIVGAEAALHAHFEGCVPEYSAEFRMLDKSGQWRWVHARGKVIERDSAGKPVRMVGTHVDITERKLSEALVAAALREKEILLQEIYHRVKNNLQVVASLLDMQARSAADRPPQQLLAESADRVKSIALVHEQLYRSGDLSRIDFHTYVRELTDQLRRAYESTSRRFAVHLDVAPIKLGIDMAIPLGLITNELVSNAYKHACDDVSEGEIRVHLAPTEDGRLCLSVADNGPGFPADFAIERTTSLGMRLIRSLVDQIEGELTIQNEGGAVFRIVFKMSAVAEGMQAAEEAA